MKNYVLLLIISFYIENVQCSYSEFCFKKCLATTVRPISSGNIDIFFEYKKAVIEVPVHPNKETYRLNWLNDGPHLPGMIKNSGKRQSRGVAKKPHEVRTRNVLVTPVEGCIVIGYEIENILDVMTYRSNNKEVFIPKNILNCENNETCQSSSLSKTRRRIKCKPRPLLVDIFSTEGKVIPDKVLTKECGGFCPGAICSKVKSKNVSLTVHIKRNNGITTCANITVPEDIRCKCKCAISKKDCTSTQNFNKENCSCDCNNNVEQEHCKNKIQRFNNQHYWDTKTCSCLCRKQSNCTTGTYWDKTRCRCSNKTADG